MRFALRLFGLDLIELELNVDGRSGPGFGFCADNEPRADEAD